MVLLNEVCVAFFYRSPSKINKEFWNRLKHWVEILGWCTAGSFVSHGEKVAL